MLSEKIKEIRKEKKITQVKLGEMIGVTGAYIQQLEKGVKLNPSMEIILKLSFALGIDINDLRTSKDEKKLSDIEKQYLQGYYTISEFDNEMCNKKNIQLNLLKSFVETLVTYFDEIPKEKTEEISTVVASWIREYVEITAKAKIQDLIEEYSTEDVK